MFNKLKSTYKLFPNPIEIKNNKNNNNNNNEHFYQLTN